MLVPVLDEIICGAGDQGVRHTLLGMAHRGRLNVLAHVLDKPYAEILAEFKDSGAAAERPPRSRLDGRREVPRRRPDGEPARPDVRDARAEPEPSRSGESGRRGHGARRRHAHGGPGPAGVRSGRHAADPDSRRRGVPGTGHRRRNAEPVRLAGYDTGGTIHIIANNQLGFTATPDESYSTSYASGLARGFKIPIVHVNADDPVACLEAARLAWEYRARFRRDFLIDLVGYRRYGHNEGDEPAFTQPVMYKAIANHPTVRAICLQPRSSATASCSADEADALVKKHFAVLEAGVRIAEARAIHALPTSRSPRRAASPAKTDTAVPIDRLREINEGLLTRPEGFTFHKKLERARENAGWPLATPTNGPSTGPRPRSWRLPRSWPTASRSG